MTETSADEHREDRLALVNDLRALLRAHGDDMPDDAARDLRTIMWRAHPDRDAGDATVSVEEIVNSVNKSLDEDFPDDAGRLS